jgi:class 3 adenylate cyclase
VTPVGSRLKERLDDRRLWFANEWFHKWHYIGGQYATEIDTFDGGKAQYAGLRFAGSPHQVYWYAIARGARKEIIDQLEWVEGRVKSYDRSVAEAAIDESADLLVGFITYLRHEAVEKDQILRGDGITFPPRREAGHWPGTSEPEIRQLATDLKKALFPPPDNTHHPEDSARSPERRLAVIFVADVVGYSHLTDRDELQTIAQVKAFKTDVLDPALKKYRGRVFNTGGDSFHLEFASVVTAIECWVEALALLKEHQANVALDRRLRFRAGMHLGEVLVDGSNLLGETVNVASRLQGLAAPDSLCASASVVDQAAKRTKLAFIDIGHQSLKNMPPVHSYLAYFSEAQTGNPPIRIDRVAVSGDAVTESSTQPPSALSASSDRAAALIAALARHCPDGLGRTNYARKDVQKLLPQASAAEIEDLVHELEAEGLVRLTKFLGGSWHLRLTSQFYENSDRPLLGWSTAKDARKIVEQMLASDTGRASTLHEALGWERRRFNPAFRHILDRLPSNFVSKERSPDYPAVTVLMRPEVRAALRKTLRPE